MAAVVLRATLSLGDEPYHQIASMSGVFVERSWEPWQGEGGGKNYFFRVNNTNDFDVMISYQIARSPPAIIRWGAHEKSVLETYDTQGAAPRFLLINVKPACGPPSPVTEITYVATAEGWLHLAAILDLFSRGVGRLEGASSRLPEDVSVLTLASARMINV